RHPGSGDVYDAVFPLFPGAAEHRGRDRGQATRRLGRRATGDQDRQQERIDRVMAKEKFIRNKPHVNIGTIGHIDHGKTSLTSAITKVLAAKGKAKWMSYAEIAKGGVVRDASKFLTVAVARVQYDAAKHHYAH